MTEVLQEKVVILTGAVRGLGLAMSLALADAGWRVGAVDIDPGTPEAFAAAKARGLDGRIVWLKGDVRNPQSCASIVGELVKRYGAIHAVVNNAGMGMQGIGNVLVGQRKKFFEVSVDNWRDAFDVNVNGPFVMTQAVVPLLVAQKWGRIVNVVTSQNTMVAEGFSPYGPTKAALEAATVIWSKDLAGTGVTVNAILPGGAADTRMIPAGEEIDRSKLIKPELMGPPIVWLLSQASDDFTSARLIAADWDPELPPAQAAAKACSPAGW
jgi:NAD(P)-dependent dehydrogenase (short-subunit alcohol dehydrogenase family)